MKVFQQNKVLTLQRFAKELGYKNAKDSDFKHVMKRLLCGGFVELQQSGYKAHSAMHPKLVVILKTFQGDPFKYTMNQTSNLNCPRCKSTKLLKKGTGISAGKMKLQCFFCDDCGFSFYVRRNHGDW